MIGGCDVNNQIKFVLDETQIPKAWYNLAADLPKPLPAVLHPGTKQPVGPADLEPLFPMALIMQEVSAERTIDIPEPIRDVYRMWRPSPLMRARRLEQALQTPAKIYYKYEGVSPAGSHKPNTAVPQAWYNKEQGIKRLSTETGAGQWGSALAFAGALFGIDVTVFQVRVSYDQKPYRRALMDTYGARCIASPSNETDSGRAILAKNPNSPGSLGIAISEAVEVAAKDPAVKYSLGSVLNHVLLHQTVNGQEAIKQFEMAGDDPDIVIGCTGGGSNFAGLAFPFLGLQLRGGRKRRFIAVEPAACPSLTRGKYAYDFGDTAHLTPLGQDAHAGIDVHSARVPRRRAALSRHGADGVAHLRARTDRGARLSSKDLLRCRCAIRALRRHRAGAGGDARGALRHRRSAALQAGRKGRDHSVQHVGPRPLRHGGLYRLLRGQAGRPEVRRRRARDGTGGAAQRCRLIVVTGA